MVGLAPKCGDCALREGAALVPGCEGLADVGREDPGGASDVQDPAFAAEDHRDDVGVAGDLAHGGGGDRAGEHQRSGTPGALDGRARTAEPAEEVPVVDGGHDLGPESAGGGKSSRGEGGLAGTDQAVEQPLRPGTLIKSFGCARVSSNGGAQAGTRVSSNGGAQAGTGINTDSGAQGGTSVSTDSDAQAGTSVNTSGSVGGSGF